MRLGIFGGTFSPPHIGHIRAAKAFVKGAELDKLLIIPTFIPPHKEIKYAAGPAQRLEMCRIAFSGIEKAEVSDIELRRGGKSYTADTLKQLRSDDVDLIILVGTDMFLSLDTWYRAQDIFKIAKIAYIRRETEDENTHKIYCKTVEYKEKFNAEIMEIVADVTEVSSTEVNERLLAGEDCGSFLTKQVYDYISARGLYK